MAKNVFQQKKRRIAHLQKGINFTEGESKNELSGCLDYVSSIIQKMDSKFDTLHSDCVKKYSKRKVTKAHQKEDNSISSCSTDFNQNPMRFKGKLSASRKFPLMEKSQKIMNQLKHNRKIPKPRAHLAALPESPVKVNLNEKPRMSKKNKKLKDKCKISNSSYARVSDNYTHNSQDVNNKDSKISNPKSVCKKEKVKSKNVCKDSASANLCRSDVNANIKKNSLSDANALKESENETTDSEYERFVNISKKSLPKKAIKKRKHSIAKTKASRYKSKSRVRKMKIKYDSDDNDVPLSSKSMKMSSFKKWKITHKVQTEIDTENVNDGSESDVVVNDMSIQDSSLISDTMNIEASANDRTLPSDEKDVCSELHEADSSYESDSTLPDISSLMNKGNMSEVINNEVPKGEILNAFSSHFKTSSDLDKTELNDHTPDLIIDLCDSEDDCKSSELSTVSASLKQKCSAIGGTTFGLSDNDHEELPMLAPKKEKCKLIDAAQDNIHPDSEESDLEIIEVITTCSKSSECKTDKPTNMLNQFKSTANYKDNDFVNCVRSNSQVIVKTENLGNACVYKTEHIIKNENSTADDCKYDAVYMTNICNEFSQDKLINQSQRTLSGEYSKSLDTSSKDGSLSDDDIVILNSVQNLTEMPHESASGILSGEKIKTEEPFNLISSLKLVKKSAHKFLKMETECSLQPQSHINKNFEKSLENKCQVECVDSKIRNIPLTEKELKIYEDMCSNSKSLPLNSSGAMVWEGNQIINKFDLIELYKKEFQTYQEIVQTEVSVGASLKLMENRQAEKVNYIRSLVQKYVETANSSDTTLTERTQLSTFERLTDDKSSVSSLKNLTESNISQMKSSFVKEQCSQDLPSSVVSSHTYVSKIDNDIKPILFNYNELENAQMLQQSTVIPKSESPLAQEYLNSHQCQSDKKQTLKLLNEKCNVCGKEAMAACQGCAKVFFCSHECGRKFWNDGHVYECGK